MADDINIVKETLAEERTRNLRAQNAYRVELEKLPQGSVTVRPRGNKRYCYLKYREGSRVVTKYAGPADLMEETLRAQVLQRKELESVLKRLERELRFIEKALRHS